MNNQVFTVRSLRIDSSSSSWLVVGRTLSMSLTLGSAPIVARALGPDGRGVTAAVFALVSIVPVIVGLGLPIAVRRVVMKEDPSSVCRSYRDISLIGFVLCGVAAALFDHFLFGSYDPRLRLAIGVCIGLCPVMAICLCDQGVLIALARYRAYAIIVMVQPGVVLVSAWILLASRTLSVTSVVVSYTLGMAASFFVSWLLVGAQWRGSRVSHQQLMVDAIRYFGGAVADVVNNRLDQLLVLPLLGAIGAGLYSVTITMMSVPVAFAHAVSAPCFREAVEASDMDSRTRIAVKALKSTMLVCGVVYGVLAALSPWIIPIVFGNSFAAAVRPTCWMMLSGLLLCIGFSLSMQLVAVGRGWSLTAFQISSVVISTVLLVVLSDSFGLAGAVIASLAGYVFLVVSIIITLRLGPRACLPTLSDVPVAWRLLR